MSPLNIHPEADVSAKKRKNNKALKILLGIGALIAVPAIGSTLAANITIGSNSTVQFGQGTATAAACDSSITVVPNASFTETDNAFSLGSVTVSDLDWAACASKTLRFRFYPTTASFDSAYTVASGSGVTTDAVIVTLGSGGYTIGKAEAGADYSVGTLTSSSTSTGTFTVTLVTQPAATNIARLTIESY